MRECWRQSREHLDMITCEGMVFVVPFALIAILEAAQGLPTPAKLLWILAALAGAGTAATTFNRLVDAASNEDDTKTPDQTPATHRGAALALLGASILIFAFAAGMLGPLPWKLAPLALLIILACSLCRRFVYFSHAALGLASACVPLGAWIAVGNRLAPEAWFLALGVMAWAAGFDLLCAMRDTDGDHRSLPALPGVSGAPRASRYARLVALAAWAQYNHMVGSHLFPWLAWLAVVAILARGQWLTRRGEPERLDHASFTLDVLVGPLLLAGHCAEWFLARGRV